jgi:hypothetical protein
MNIRDRVLANSDLDAMRALRDLDGLAAALNAEGLKVRTPNTFVTWRAVTTRCASGKSIKSKMRAAAPLNEDIDTACMFLSQDAGLDVGDEGTWLAIDAMVTANVLTEDEGAQLKRLAMAPLIVSRLDVEAALFNPNGTEK